MSILTSLGHQFFCQFQLPRSRRPQISCGRPSRVGQRGGVRTVLDGPGSRTWRFFGFHLVSQHVLTILNPERQVSMEVRLGKKNEHVMCKIKEPTIWIYQCGTSPDQKLGGSLWFLVVQISVAALGFNTQLQLPHHRSQRSHVGRSQDAGLLPHGTTEDVPLRWVT